jgi:3-hydroxyisobutyrate dehydrogenase
MLYRRLLPTLEKLGHPRYFGPAVEAGAVTKLVGQHLVFNGLSGISTATALHAAQFNQQRIGGEAQADYLGFLNGGAGGTRQWDVAMKKGVEEGVWNEGFSIAHAVVDAIYAAQLAQESGLPRCSIQVVIQVALGFSFLLREYPDQGLATHAIVREMLDGQARELDTFMLQHGMLAPTVDQMIADCVDSLPPRVRESVFAAPMVEDFVKAGRSASQT